MLIGSPEEPTTVVVMAGAALGLGGAILGFVLLFTATLVYQRVAAPYRQRDKARAQVRDLLEREEQRRSRPERVVSDCLAEGNRLVRAIRRQWDEGKDWPHQVEQWVDATHATLQREVPEHAEEFLVEGYPNQSMQPGPKARAELAKQEPTVGYAPGEVNPYGLRVTEEMVGSQNGAGS